MSVETKQVAHLENGASGVVKGVALETGEIGKVEKVVVTTTITCDNPSCTYGYEGTQRKITFTDNPEDSVPPELYKTLVVTLANEHKYVFCCGPCTNKFLVSHYTPLDAPKDNVVVMPSRPA